MTSLIAYDAAGNVLATLDQMIALDEHGKAIGHIDFAAHESNGGEHTDIWRVDGAAGSKTWPEHLGSLAHDYRVELVGEPGQKRIAALVHRETGERWEQDAKRPEPPPRAPNRLPLIGG